MPGENCVVVVGAGPTGLTLACGLLAGGAEVRVVDRAAGPARTSRALGLQPRGVEVLDRLGALGDLPSRSLPVNQVVVNVNGRELGRLAVGGATRLGRHVGLLVSQAEIEAELRRRLGELGGAVEWGRELVGLDQDRDGVRLRLDGGESLVAGWVVGCDGAHSRVRKAVGIGFPGVPLIERFAIADVRADFALPRDAVTVWLRGEHMIAVFPLPGADLWRLMAPLPGTQSTDPGAAQVRALLTAAVAEEGGYPASAVRSADWTSTFQIHRRLADTYRRGRVLLAGDAAHIHSPLGGQGMNTGIGDAENLAWKLAAVGSGRARPALLDTFEAERRPIAAEVLGSTSSMTRLVFADGPISRLVRDWIFVPLLNRPLVQRLIAEQASQLKVSYRGGPLAAGGRSLRRGVRPGDRVADLDCVRSDGSPTRLHAELGPGWALLGAPSGTELIDVVRDRLGESAVVQLLPDSLRGSAGDSDALLVRPDGHQAWRGRDPASLRRWLATALGPPAAVVQPL